VSTADTKVDSGKKGVTRVIRPGKSHAPPYLSIGGIVIPDLDASLTSFLWSDLTD